LAYLLGNLEFVLEGLKEPGGAAVEMSRALEAARDGALRIQQVTRDLRMLARSDARDPKPVDVGDVIGSAISMAHREIHHRARLVLDLQPTPAVLGDAARLGQLMVNLLVNAAQAIEEGDAEGNEVRVRTRLDPGPGRVVVEVEDTGDGIPEEVREHLFDPFVTTKPMSQGTGLGLAICRQIVDSHAGEISFESKRGQGTTFRISLPSTGSLPVAPRPQAEVRRGRARVLVIDDDALLVDAFVRVLRKEHDVVAFTSSREALEHITTQDPYHVILCDLMMPELSGMEVFAAVAKRDPELASRFLFMTGGAFTPKAQQFVQENRERTIDKPIRMAALRTLVTRYAFERHL